MKHLLFILAFVCLAGFSACSDKSINPNNPTPPTPPTPTPQDTLSFTDLVSGMNVKSATMLYAKKPKNSRSLKSGKGVQDQFAGFFKLNKDQKEEPVYIYDKFGNPSSLFHIDNIIRANDTTLFVSATGEDTIRHISYYQSPFMVSLKSEKIYYIPSGQYQGLFNESKSNYKLYASNNGIVYYSIGHQNQVYKIDTKKRSIQPILPGKFEVNLLGVTNDGYIILDENLIRCPGGREIRLDVTKHFFICKNKIYSISEFDTYPPYSFSIYEYKKTDNNLEEKQIYKINCDYPYEFDPSLLAILGRESFLNTINNNFYFIGIHVIIDFDGKNLEKIPNDSPIINNELVTRYGELYPIGKGAFFIFNHNMGQDERFGYYIDYNNRYAVTQINLSDFYIYETSSNPTDGSLEFSAMRYSDEANVVGHIEPSGSIVIDQVNPNDTEITNMIPLN